MTGRSLDLNEFRKVSVERMHRWHEGGEEWTSADWSNAMCGEAGEAANVVKKMRRVETGLKPYSKDYEALKLLLADELADTFAYMDLLANFYDIDLSEAIARKFNIVSIREGFPERIELGNVFDRMQDAIAKDAGRSDPS